MATATDKVKAPRKPRSASTCKAIGESYTCQLTPGHAGPHIDTAAAIMWTATVTVVGELPKLPA